MRRAILDARASLVASAIFGLAVGTVSAEPELQQGADAPVSLDEIVITAQRRSESQQSVPISVDAFSASTLAAKGATTTEDLPLLVSGLTLQPSGSGEPIFIRGIGNSNSAVPLFVDGVFQAFPDGRFVFNNVDNIEVDKGPQGTLFGRNATGGVVQVTTKTPSSTPSGDIEIGYGNYQTVTTSVYATTGIAPGVASDVAFYYYDQGQGWGRDLATTTDVYKNDEMAIRNKTLWNITDKANATLILNYRSSKGSVGTDIQAMAAGNNGYLFNEVTGTTFTIPGKYDVDGNLPPNFENTQGAASLRLDNDFGPFTGVSISSWQRSRTQLNIDYDGTPIPFFNLLRKDYEDAVTQEFQLLSPEASPIRWVAGAFYSDINSRMAPFGFGGIGGSAVFGAPPGDAYDIFANYIQKSYAFFGQTSVTVLPDTHLTLGARLTSDHPSISGYTAGGPTIVPGSSGSASTSFTRPTFRVALDHNFSTDVLTYISYNRGYNTGGYNEVNASGFAPGQISSVNPETVNAYEIGVKSEWLEHRLRVNAAAFWYDYDNMQTETYSDGGAVTLNAAQARVKGIDMDFQYRPISNLTFSASMEVLDSRYTKYTNAPIYSIVPSGALIATEGNATGNYTVSAPKWGANGAVTYVVPTPVGDFSSNGTVTFSGPWYGDSSNVFEEPAHHLINLSETWTSANTKNTVSAWAKNIGNVYYDLGINVLTPVGATGNPGPPRTYGITYGRKF